MVAQKRSGRPRKSWDEVIKNDRKKLDMDSADPQNRSEWRGRLRRRLVKKAQPSVEENGLLNGYDDDDDTNFQVTGFNSFCKIHCFHFFPIEKPKFPNLILP